MSNKRKAGDRKDGRLLRDLDSMHFICPILYPNRCDNEAFISEKIDLTNLQAYLDKKNAGNPEFKYTMFQVITVAMLRVLHQRPKLNRFIVNGNTYQRNEVTASFVVKKLFSDNGAEGLAMVHAGEHDNIDTIHQEIYEQISIARSDEKSDSTDDAMDLFNSMPRWLSKFIIHIIMWLDKHGWVPKSLIANDPYYSSVVLTNLGSLKLHSGYHHLTNWGTNSVFVAVGERKMRPFSNEDGSFTMKDSIDLGLTIDERLGDGYYYSKSIRLLRRLLEQPELLEQEFCQEVEY